MLLAGDVGGTKTLIGLFARDAHRPRALCTRVYATTDAASFDQVLDQFLSDAAREVGTSVAALGIEGAAFGVAGPVVAGRVSLTNGAWTIVADEVAARVGCAHATLVNDLVALATAVPLLLDTELAVLQDGSPDPTGNAVVMAAGTGLGEASLHRVNGALVPVPSEGGHADFAPRTEREIALLRALVHERGRAELDQVVSGSGLARFAQLTHADQLCDTVTDRAAPDPATVSASALAARCPRCVDALDLFVSAYGAEAGNLALRNVASAGVFIGGGIAPKILPALLAGGFMAAFLDKPPMAALLSRMPVNIILNSDAVLLGAAIVAARG